MSDMSQWKKNRASKKVAQRLLDKGLIQTYLQSRSDCEGYERSQLVLSQPVSSFKSHMPCICQFICISGLVLPTKSLFREKTRLCGNICNTVILVDPLGYRYLLPTFLGYEWYETIYCHTIMARTCKETALKQPHLLWKTCSINYFGHDPWGGCGWLVCLNVLALHLGKSNSIQNNTLRTRYDQIWSCSKEFNDLNMNKTLSLLTPWPSWSSFFPIHSVGALRSCNEISGVGDPATLNVTLNAGSHCAGAVYKIQKCLWIVLHFSVRLTVQIIHPPSPYLSWTSHLPFRTADRVQ